MYQQRSIGTRLTDWALSIVSPTRYLARQEAQLLHSDAEFRKDVVAAMERAASGYRSGKSTNNKAPWVCGAATADAEISTSLPAMRDRSRQTDRDDSVGHGLINTFVSNVVGRGFIPQVRTDDRTYNRNAEAVWRERKDELFPQEDISHEEHQKLAYRCSLVDGDGIIKESVFSENEPLTFEMYEGDWLATPWREIANPRIRDGVERDADGKIIRYHLVQDGPTNSLVVDASLVSRKTVAYPKDIIRHIKRVERVKQTRGVPLYHASLLPIRDLDLLTDASMTRLQMASCIAAFIQSNADMASMLGGAVRGTSTDTQYGYKIDQPLTPGMMWKLYPGEEVKAFIPNFPAPELFPFIISIARYIGTSVGVCWQTVLRDFADANYSSARANILMDRMTFKEHKKWFVDRVLNWEWSRVMADARLRGDRRVQVGDAQLNAVEWVSDGWEWVDPMKEAAGERIQLDSWTSCIANSAGRRGDDWEWVIEQRATEIVKMLSALREKLDAANMGYVKVETILPQARGWLDELKNLGIDLDEVMSGKEKE